MESCICLWNPKILSVRVLCWDNKYCKEFEDYAEEKEKKEKKETSLAARRKRAKDAWLDAERLMGKKKMDELLSVRAAINMSAKELGEDDAYISSIVETAWAKLGWTARSDGVAISWKRVKEEKIDLDDYKRVEKVIVDSVREVLIKETAADKRAVAKEETDAEATGEKEKEKEEHSETELDEHSEASESKGVKEEEKEEEVKEEKQEEVKKDEEEESLKAQDHEQEEHPDRQPEQSSPELDWDVWAKEVEATSESRKRAAEWRESKLEKAKRMRQRDEEWLASQSLGQSFLEDEEKEEADLEVEVEKGEEQDKKKQEEELIGAIKWCQRTDGLGPIFPVKYVGGGKWDHVPVDEFPDPASQEMAER